MKTLRRDSPSLSEKEQAMFDTQPVRIQIIYVEEQVGSDRLIYCITRSYEENTASNRSEFKTFADEEVEKAVQRNSDNPSPLTGPDRDTRLLQPIEDIGKSL